MVRILRSKKGWIRIVEATLAIMLLAGFLMFILAGQKSSSNIDSYIYNIEKSLLRDISQSDEVRQNIILGENDKVEEFIEKNIPANLDFSSRICEIGDVCGCLDCPVNRDVYADSAFIASTLQDYKPKQIKLFIWRKN